MSNNRTNVRAIVPVRGTSVGLARLQRIGASAHLGQRDENFGYAAIVPFHEVDRAPTRSRGRLFDGYA